MFLGDGTTQLLICNRKTEGTIFTACLSISIIYGDESLCSSGNQNWNACRNSSGRTELVADDFLKRLLPLLLSVLKDWDMPCSS